MPDRKHRGAASAAPTSEATGHRGISRLASGSYRVTFTRTFLSLAEALAWRESVTGKKAAPSCPVCSREVVSPRRVYCSKQCSSRAKREATREAARTRRSNQRSFVKYEKNISFDGAVFKAYVAVGGIEHVRYFSSLGEARTYRDDLIARREAALKKACPECGAQFVAKKSDRVYCSEECGDRARSRGVLVRPAGALPSTRRRARQLEKQRQEARKIEILSGPGTFADAYNGVQKILRDHVAKQKGTA